MDLENFHVKRRRLHTSSRLSFVMLIDSNKRLKVHLQKTMIFVSIEKYQKLNVISHNVITYYRFS